VFAITIFYLLLIPAHRLHSISFLIMQQAIHMSNYIAYIHGTATLQVMCHSALLQPPIAESDCSLFWLVKSLWWMYHRWFDLRTL